MPFDENSSSNSQSRPVLPVIDFQTSLLYFPKMKTGKVPFLPLFLKTVFKEGWTKVRVSGTVFIGLLLAGINFWIKYKEGTASFSNWKSLPLTIAQGVFLFLIVFTF